MNYTIKIPFAALLFMVLSSCGSHNRVTEADKSHSHIISNYYGEGFEHGKAVSILDAVVALKKSDKVSIQLEGIVQDVCQAKGCWMTIADQIDSEQKFFVKFKDYGFFVPMDISGRTVVMNGEAFRALTSVDELRHYAEDAGKSAAEIAAITEPEEEYKFIATGVYLQPQ